MKTQVAQPEIAHTHTHDLVTWIHLGYVLVFTFFAYSPTLSAAFLNWDDVPYVVENPVIRQWSLLNIKRIFTEYTFGNYHPLTILSLSVDYALGKLNPQLYHCTNILLHLGNTALVFFLVRKLSPSSQTALICAILFGLHPIHVESVAWIAERKDVLYTFFYFWALICYVRYTREQKTSLYVYTLALFLLSILSKAMAVSLPLILLAIDYLLKRKIFSRTVLLEKVPFFLLALFFGLVAIWAQKASQSIVENDPWNFAERIVLASYAFVQYLIKLLCPIQLSAIYPYPEKSGQWIPLIYVAYVLAVLLVGGLVLYSVRFTRTYLFGFLFFTASICMVLQLLPVGRFIMADRYAYIPSLGVFWIMVVCFQKIVSGFSSHRKFIIGLGFVYLALLAAGTYRQSTLWKDDLSLWNDAVQQYPDFSEAYNLRAHARIKHNDTVGAYADFDKCIVLNGDNKAGYYGSRAGIKASVKDYVGALKDYSLAISFADTTKMYASSLYINRGAVYAELKNFSAAFTDFERAEHLPIVDPDFFLNRGILFLESEKYTEAIADLNHAIVREPNSKEAYYHRAEVYYLQGKGHMALQDCNQAIKIDPAYAKAYNLRGLLEVKIEQFQKALSTFSDAIEADPLLAEAYYNRAYLNQSLGLTETVCEDMKQAYKLGYRSEAAYMQQICPN
ncbi:tetratricopeptide repeat protein [Cytophagaceae bacterium YF14B1]|uniref:Tetratricopeptide repeat protein n=1 Tax=Xanthocytophaga flava TaxID=3048013 RepID=A0AAE3QTV5_9BACT|nr:tetratricopeptide repeat protein [Xanthocytophaga flavus]MDJ1482543.1 tetratricopeptide repeat protein [Xanthocytophaga flavus]